MDIAEALDKFVEWLTEHAFVLGIVVGVILTLGGQLACSAKAAEADLPDPRAAVQPDKTPRVLLKCGSDVIDLTGMPEELQIVTFRAAQRQIRPNDFLNVIHKQWPQLVDGAARLLVMCGAG